MNRLCRYIIIVWVAMVLPSLVMTSCVGCSDASRDGVTTVDSLLSIADSLTLHGMPQEAMKYQMRAYMKASDETQRSDIRVRLAMTHFDMGNVDVSLSYLEQSVAYYDTMRYMTDSVSVFKLKALVGHAEVLSVKGDVSSSVRQYMRASALARHLGDFDVYYKCQMFLLRHEEMLGNYGSAIDGYRELLKKSETYQQRFVILRQLHHLFLSMGNVSESVIYLNELRFLVDESDVVGRHRVHVAEMQQACVDGDSLMLRSCVGRLRDDIGNVALDDSLELNAMGLLAEYYMNNSAYDSAKYYIGKFCQHIGDDTGRYEYAYAMLIKAQSLLHENRLDSARVVLTSDQMRLACHDRVELESRYYGLMSDLHFKKGDYRSSYDCLCRMATLSDSVRLETLSHNLAYRDMEHQRDTTILSNSIKLRLEESRVEALAFWQSLGVYLIIAIIIVVLIVFLNIGIRIMKDREKDIQQQNIRLQHEIVRHTTQLQSQKVELEMKNNKLNKEIEYASRIQRDILPSESLLNTPMLSGHFVFYRPCAHISGDFYWFCRRGSKVYVCCGDATGHGIPGAFVAMVCTTILNDQAARGESMTASDILVALDNEMRNILQNNENVHGNDSVDMTLVCLNEETDEVTLAMARQTAFVVTAQDEMLQLHGVKRSIGDLDEAFVARDFTEVTFKRSDINAVYITSDGLESQFGGFENKKLKRKGVNNLFARMAQNPMMRQRALLDDFFVSWKGLNTQTDDVLVIGLSFVAPKSR